MQFENRFEVDAPLERVWEAVLDVERVAPTVPGAQVLERTGEDAYKVAIRVKVGPMSMTYRGDVEVVERDEAAHRAVLRARAKESRGQGTADADVTMVLSGGDGRTEATITTEVDLSGKVATMGQGVLQDVSGRLVQTFARNLAEMLRTPTREQPALQPPAEPATQPPHAETTAASAPATAPSPSPPPPPRERPPADALDLGSVGGAVLAERLRDPRALGALFVLVAVVAFLLGRRSAR